jgi:hypothetical protein
LAVNHNPDGFPWKGGQIDAALEGEGALDGREDDIVRAFEIFQQYLAEGVLEIDAGLS